MSKAKRLGKIKQAVVDQKYYGTEPVLNKNSTTLDIVNYYNWHNYFHNDDDAKEFVIDYLKSKKFPKSKIKAVSRIESIKLRTVGWNFRTLTLGGDLPKNMEDDSLHLLENLCTLLPEEQKEDESCELPTKPIVSIQQRIANRASNLIGDLESELDKFYADGKNDLNIPEWFQNNAIKPAIANLISEYYAPLYSELYDALSGEDETLKEAYDHWTKTQLKNYVAFVKEILSTAETFAVPVRIERKPRKKKEKPAALIVKKLKYKEKDDEHCLVSIAPANIIGSDQLWIYNIKSRTLTVYNALGPVGLSVKGTTITGYDEKTSICKKLRKPEDILPRVLEGGKLVLRKLMDDLTTTAKEANGRINNDIILLRTIK